MVDEFVYYCQGRYDSSEVRHTETRLSADSESSGVRDAEARLSLRSDGSPMDRQVLDAEIRICAALRLDLAIPSALDFLYCLLRGRTPCTATPCTSHRSRAAHRPPPRRAPPTKVHC